MLRWESITPLGFPSRVSPKAASLCDKRLKMRSSRGETLRSRWLRWCLEEAEPPPACAEPRTSPPPRTWGCASLTFQLDLPLTDLTTLIPSESASSTRRGFTSRTVTITFRQAGAELRMLRRFDWICHVLLNMRFLDSVYLIKGNYHSHFTFGDDKAASFRAEGIIEGNVHHGIAI